MKKVIRESPCLLLCFDDALAFYIIMGDKLIRSVPKDLLEGKENGSFFVRQEYILEDENGKSLCYQYAS